MTFTDLNDYLKSVHKRNGQCLICSRLFPDTYLEKHISTIHPNYLTSVQTVPDPQECEICDGVFNSYENLANHMKTVHKDDLKFNPNFEHFNQG